MLEPRIINLWTDIINGQATKREMQEVAANHKIISEELVKAKADILAKDLQIESMEAGLTTLAEDLSKATEELVAQLSERNDQ